MLDDLRLDTETEVDTVRAIAWRVWLFRLRATKVLGRPGKMESEKMERWKEELDKLR